MNCAGCYRLVSVMTTSSVVMVNTMLLTLAAHCYPKKEITTIISRSYSNRLPLAIQQGKSPYEFGTESVIEADAMRAILYKPLIEASY
jgi:hypothetical protein